MSVYLNIVALGLAIFGIHYWLNNKTYIFEAEDIARIAKRQARKDSSIQEKFSTIALELERIYPGHILPEEDRDWLFVNCGGWMGSMYVLHASLTESVIFFGTAMDTSGNSGRFWANVSYTVLTGSFRQWKEGHFQTQRYSTGDTVTLGSGEACGMQWTSGTWTVEYGRGFMPSALGFSLADSIFGTMDFVQIFKIGKMYTRSLVQETILELFKVIETIKKENNILS